jgi:hypothetical protein
MAKSLVGLEGRGEATVFGGHMNPLAAYMQVRAGRQRQQQQEQLAKQKQIDEVLDYNDKFRPETKFQDLNYTLANEARNVSDITRQRLRETQNPGLVMAEAQNMQREVLALKSEMDGWKQDIDVLDKTVLDLQGKGILKPEARQAVRYGWRNQDGSAKSIPEIRQWANRMGDTLNDPTIYDPKGTAKNWVSGLQDQTYFDYEKQKGATGYNEDDLKYTIESKLKYEIDPTDGKALKLDKENNPIPIINEYVLNQAKKDPHMRIIIDAYGGGTTESQIQYLKGLIDPGKDITNWGNKTITRGQRKPTDSNLTIIDGVNFGVGSKDNQTAVDRFKNIEYTLTNVSPGDLSQYVDLSKGEEAYYEDSGGNKIVGSEEKNGRTIYRDEKGNSVGKPAKIVMRRLDPGKAKANEMQELMIMTNASLTDDQKAEKIAKLQKSYTPVKFDLTTKAGRLQAHNEMSDILDTKFNKGQSLKEKYKKVLDTKYSQKQAFNPLNY